MPLFAILTAFMGPIFHGVSNIIDAHVAGKLFTRLTTVIFYNGLTNFLAIPFILYFGVPQKVPSDVVIYLLVINLIDVCYQFPYYAALKKVDTSIVAAMFSLGKIIIPVLAYFMIGEKLHWIQYVGFFLVISFNLILNIQSPKNFHINIGFWLMLAVSLMLSVQGVLYKKVLNEIDWVTAAFWCAVITNSLCLGFVLFPTARKGIRADFSIYRKKIKLFLVMELFDQLGHLPGKFALSFLPVVVLKAINATQPLFVLLYGIILYYLFGDRFKENVTRSEIIKKLVCFIIIVIGVVLVIC